MKQNISPIIEVSKLQELYGSKELVVIDATNGPKAKEAYLKEHLAQAVHVDLNNQLSSIKDDFSDGGRHPLPDSSTFSNTLSQLGITPASHVVVYDNNNGAIAATRVWWMLRAIGHKMVQVLNGGIQEAMNSGLAIDSGDFIPKPAPAYQVSAWQWPIASMSQVEESIEKENAILIDVRETERFDGLNEPIDLIAGHIPGAVNIPFSSNLNDQGLFKSVEDLKAKYDAILGNIHPDNVTVHCGSGVTACHTILALEYAGFKIPKLYVGSWSEWSRNEKPMITKV